MAQDFRELRVWQDAMALAEAIHAATRACPPDERFGPTGQVRRASACIASCLAEGNARSSTRDYLRFLSMAPGSLAEVETQRLLAKRFGYLSDEGRSMLRGPLHALARQLQALIKALSSKLARTQTFPASRSPFPAP